MCIKRRQMRYSLIWQRFVLEMHGTLKRDLDMTKKSYKTPTLFTVQPQGGNTRAVLCFTTLNVRWLVHIFSVKWKPVRRNTKVYRQVTGPAQRLVTAIYIQANCTRSQAVTTATCTPAVRQGLLQVGVQSPRLLHPVSWWQKPLLKY